jgi:hypothetical protein
MRASHIASISGLDFARFILRADGIVVLIGGIALIVGARPISRTLGVDHAFIPVLLGIVFLPYALMLIARPVTRRALLIPAIGNTAWVAISAVMLVIGTPAFSATGRWIVGGAAIAVALFAVVEFAAVQRASAAG